MNWRDQYRKGSFRGAEFTSQTSESAGGRRVETHEYPRRDTPWSEDLGRVARQSTLEAFVSGPGYRDARDALIAALEAEGAGTLIHPWDGRMQVAIPTWSCRDSTDEGGIAFFTIQFVEAGKALDKPAGTDRATDRGAVARTLSAATIAAAPRRFASRFSVAGVANFVEGGAAKLVAASATAAALAGGLQGGAGSALRAFEAGLAFLPASALSLVRSPLALGHAVVGLVAAVGGLGGSPTARVAGLSSLVAFASPPVLGQTTARVRERANAAAYVDLVTSVAAAELVAAIADARVASYQDAVSIRDAAAALIEDRVIAAADAGEDETADAFAGLLRAMVADVTQRGGSLARVYGYTPATTEPALVIAARLGAGSALVELADDLATRNRVAHPGFVPDGSPIEVLANG